MRCERVSSCGCVRPKFYFCSGFADVQKPTVKPGSGAGGEGAKDLRRSGPAFDRPLAPH